MQEIKKLGFQGDVCFRRIRKLPDGLQELPREDGAIIVAHSETGHHHAIHDGETRLLAALDRDPLVCYLAIDGAYADVVHHRSFDTHATVRLPRGVYEVRRQREFVPEGWRRVED